MKSMGAVGRDVGLQTKPDTKQIGSTKKGPRLTTRAFVILADLDLLQSHEVTVLGGDHQSFSCFVADEKVEVAEFAI